MKIKRLGHCRHAWGRGLLYHAAALDFAHPHCPYLPSTRHLRIAGDGYGDSAGDLINVLTGPLAP